MTDTHAKDGRLSEIEGLIDAYWAIAYTEGLEGRGHPAGDAQRIRSAITERLAALSVQPSEGREGTLLTAIDPGAIHAIISQILALRAQPSEPVAQELYALCYLHDWEEPKPGQEHRWEPGKNVFPEVHAFYRTWQEAEAVRKDMSNPNRYWVVRARSETEARLAKVAASPPPSVPARVEITEEMVTTAAQVLDPTAFWIEPPRIKDGEQKAMRRMNAHILARRVLECALAAQPAGEE